MFSKARTLFIVFLSVTTPEVFAESKKPLTWQIKNKSWNRSYEKSYEEFIATLGKGKKSGACHTTADCIKSPVANPRYYNLNPTQLANVFSDCADLPYILKAYFSWMNDLPFAYPVNLSPAAPKTAESQALLIELEKLNQELEKASFFKKQVIKAQIRDLRKKIYGAKDTDVRYNRFGNNILAKRYIKNGDNINQVLDDVAMSISTATFRTDASNNTTSTLFRDTYPVSISRNSIKPGTILYDPNGHIAVVYEVSKTGKIHLIDAHPDNSLTAITYGEKFSQTNVEIGGGFSNWRPFSTETGEVDAASNEELSDYSLEQFQRNKKFEFNNVSMDFHEYVRNKMSVGTLVYSPTVELTELVEEICHDVQEREMAINTSLSKGIQNQNHPEKLPGNIYGTDGDWEDFSTPSRDARLKASVREGHALIIRMIEGYKNGDQSIQYAGMDLTGDLKRIYREASRKCVIEVKKTNGSTQSLDLNTILANIFKLSFDPYHCVELRWGMTDAESLKSCNQSKEKLDWYQAEQGIRNLIDRDYSVKMDYSLRELPNTNFYRVKEENISIEKIFENY